METVMRWEATTPEGEKVMVVKASDFDALSTKNLPSLDEGNDSEPDNT